jgi:hypothetical protein
MIWNQKYPKNRELSNLVLPIQTKSSPARGSADRRRDVK